MTLFFVDGTNPPHLKSAACTHPSCFEPEGATAADDLLPSCCNCCVLSTEHGACVYIRVPYSCRLLHPRVSTSLSPRREKSNLLCTKVVSYSIVALAVETYLYRYAMRKRLHGDVIITRPKLLRLLHGAKERNPHRYVHTAVLCNFLSWPCLQDFFFFFFIGLQYFTYHMYT